MLRAIILSAFFVTPIWAMEKSQDSLNHDLLRAIAAQKPHKVLEALEKNADANACNKDGLSALHCAITQGNVEILILLLAYNATPSYKCFIEQNLLEKQSQHTKPLKKKILEIVHNADRLGEYAIEYGVIPVIRRLYNPHNINILDKDLITPLCYAVINDRIDMVKFLMTLGAELNPTATSQTPLSLARKLNNPIMEKKLTELGARDVRPRAYSSPPSHHISRQEKSKKEVLRDKVLFFLN